MNKELEVKSLEQAVSVLRQATASFKGSRADFILMDNAFRFIEELKQCKCPGDTSSEKEEEALKEKENV